MQHEGETRCWNQPSSATQRNAAARSSRGSPRGAIEVLVVRRGKEERRPESEVVVSYHGVMVWETFSCGLDRLLGLEGIR